MKYRDASKEVFHGLPIEHCPLCGELISIEKIEIVQQEEINCIYCKQSIKAYLPKSAGQLFFTKECYNCDKMNNTRSQYCVYCGYSFSVKRKKIRITVTKIGAYISLGFSLFGIIFLTIAFVIAITIGRVQFGMISVGSIAMLIGFVLGVISYIDPNARPIAKLSLLITGFLDSTAIIFVIIVFIVMAS